MQTPKQLVEHPSGLTKDMTLSALVLNASLNAIQGMTLEETDKDMMSDGRGLR